ncbi:MAG: alpha/beta hydrolase [Solidesulfovibrio sp.]|uniref:alpha/beta hydrolase n=1 Tax=Solidesulfovibrio sp. TaxID=2910990 RepID=UPI002B1FEE86|nr:alpha/beta hydrolase [Solidesulfovibrio sp.]MEA4855931.1 alpha/beta hydrolase [Solidesulfovibrio sp.]
MKIVVILGLALGLAYCGYLVMLYLGQDAMVFPGRAADPAREAEIRRYYPRLEDFTVTAADGTKLSGYYLPRTLDGKPAPAVLYFCGNAEEQTGFFLWSPNELRPYGVAGLDYRGYGRSGGKPSEAALKADALAAYDALAEKLGQGGRILVMGRSLGTALAAHVAARRPVAGIILVTPFASLAGVGAESHPFVPVRLLLTAPFDVVPDAGRVTAPALFLVAGADSHVPPRHAERLAAAWGGPKEVRVIDGTGHNNIVDAPEYWKCVKAFVKACLG